jgi:hypothetical protein
LAALITDISTATLLTCPHPGCNVRAEVYELESLLDDTTYQKYLQFSALESLKKEKTTRWCINKECGMPIVWDETVPTVICPACKTQFCYSCSKPAHPGKSCSEAAEPPPSESAISINADPDSSYSEWRRQLGAKVKPCPNCSADIEKNLGCQHMTCSNCRFQCMFLFSGVASSSSSSSAP